MQKQTLFISYCWKDGNTYADELETQLKYDFDVKRDKSQLIPNDDINDFMAGIANCDNVIVVLTAEYVKSLNCMLEMSYLVSQEDWPQKSMILVIDESIYSTERKLEIINYWQLRQKKMGWCKDHLHGRPGFHQEHVFECPRHHQGPCGYCVGLVRY